MLSLRHYQIFAEAAGSGSFTKAAQRLYLTQSAVSHTIRDLEEAFGAPLFERSSRKVTLTAGGRLLLEEVTPLLASFADLESRIGRLGKQAPLQLVSSITIAAFWLPAFLTGYREALPEVPVKVQVVPAAEAVRILREGGADLAFVEGVQPQGPFQCFHFAAYRMKAVCASFHKAAGKHLSAAAFCQEELLLRESGSAIRDTVESCFFLRGYSLRPSWESVNSMALLEAAKAGLGITILPEMLVQSALEEGTLAEVYVEDLCFQNDMIVVYRQEKLLSPAVQKMVELLQQF